MPLYIVGRWLLLFLITGLVTTVLMLSSRRSLERADMAIQLGTFTRRRVAVHGVLALFCVAACIVSWRVATALSDAGQPHGDKMPTWSVISMFAAAVFLF